MRPFERRSLVRNAAQRVISDFLPLQSVSSALEFKEGRHPHLMSGLTVNTLISILRLLLNSVSTSLYNHNHSPT